ncbi:MAG: hypothetical protein ABL916_24360 [Burkholderiaceae bacterium]
MAPHNNMPNELLPHLGAIVVRCLQGAGLPEARSSQVASDVVAAVQDAFGGERHYIPGSQRVAKSDRAIEAGELKRKGLSVREISGRLRCTRNYVYELLLIERKRLSVDHAPNPKPRKKT